MTKLLLKVHDCEFEIKFKTKRKTCPSCNGTGQIMDYDFNELDECDICLGGGQFIDSFMRNMNDNAGNIYFFEKYLSKNDFVKVKLAHSLTSAWNRIDDSEGSIYQDDYKDNCIIIPHFGYLRPTEIKTNNGKNFILKRKERANG